MNDEASTSSDSLHPTIAVANALSATQQLRQNLDATQDAVLVLGAQNEELQRQLENALAQALKFEVSNKQLLEENQRLVGHCEEMGTRCQASESQRQRLHDDLHRERRENKALQEHIRDLHYDLAAQDIPSLVLKMAMQLTGAEVGLFTEADGDGTLASIGFDELQEFLVDAVYQFSRRTAETEEPTVENEAEKLPDGSGLVNLAALPFAAKGEMRGVLLLANKRSGPFTDSECEILMAIGQHAGLAMENARLHHQLGEAYIATVAVLADAIEAKDAYTRGHCEDVSRVAVEVGRRLGLEGTALDEVRYAALLHDVGKIGIPDGILLKPGRLMSEEFSIIKKHAAIGRDLVGRVPALSHLGDVILHHHERFDGSGYPDGLQGESIPLVSRIIGIVDAFNAMTTPRPYREPVGTVEAFEEMRRCAGSHFDPHIVDIVTQVLIETETEIPSQSDKP